MHTPEKTQDSFMSLARLSGESIFCIGRTVSPVWKGLFFPDSCMKGTDSSNDKTPMENKKKEQWMLP